MAMGKDAKLYYLSTGTRVTWGSPAAAPANLAEISTVRDLTLPGERHVGDTSARGDDHDTGDVGAISSKELSFDLAHRDTDAGRDALRDAFEGRTVIALAVLNGGKAVVGARGLWADWKVSKFEEVQTLTGAIGYNVTVVKYASGVDGEWVVVSA
ncbi:hypothetical protein LCGC14_2151330 [marine sediment metagenome]|uniref:Phage tail protein n=1 Tax=marine sediment metagenome TaxID=412755 RepID=A0A0F9G8J6_9ZZZZ